MPIYSYNCVACGKEFDFLVGVGMGTEEVKCSGCGSQRVEKQFAAFGIAGTNSKSSGSSCSSCASHNCSSCG